MGGLSPPKLLCKRLRLVFIQTGDIFSPFDATAPSIMIEAGCLAVGTLRHSETSFPSAKALSFWLLKTRSTVKFFPSEKLEFNSRVYSGHSTNGSFSQTLLNHCCSQREFHGTSQTFSSHHLIILDTVEADTLFFYASLVIFWHDLFPKTYLMASWFLIKDAPLGTLRL